MTADPTHVKVPARAESCSNRLFLQRHATGPPKSYSRAYFGGRLTAREYAILQKPLSRERGDRGTTNEDETKEAPGQ